MARDGLFNIWDGYTFGGWGYIPYFMPNVKINKELDIKSYYQSARKNDIFPG